MLGAMRKHDYLPCYRCGRPMLGDGFCPTCAQWLRARYANPHAHRAAQEDMSMVACPHCGKTALARGIVDGRCGRCKDA